MSAVWFAVGFIAGAATLAIASVVWLVRVGSEDS